MSPAPLRGATDRPPRAPVVLWEWSSTRPFWQAAYRPRDVAKQRVPARTSDQSELQARRGFRMFAQVSGLGCIDLGDRRSEVQILSARQR